MAWTIDDGTDPDVVAAYAQMAEQTGNRLTFFVNGNQPSWTIHAQRLRPLVASGQIQLGNHTWSHPDLRALSTQGIQDQLQRNEDFIQNLYEVSAKPFYRPPFGYINGHVRDAGGGHRVHGTHPVVRVVVRLERAHQRPDRPVPASSGSEPGAS